MYKLITGIIFVLTSGLCGCGFKKSEQPKAVQSIVTPESPVVNPKNNDARQYSDQMTFTEYLDDGDYFQLLAIKADSTISFINDSDTSRSLNRGDAVQVTWKNDTITIPGDNESKMPAKILLSIKKTADGPVSTFRKAYGKKLKYTWPTDEEFTTSYLDKVYLLTEYYLTQTKNPLLKLAVKNKDELTYSIESQERNGRNYRMIGIAPVGPNGSNVVQWLYVDEESGKVYEYNLAEDKLLKFN